MNGWFILFGMILSWPRSPNSTSAQPLHFEASQSESAVTTASLKILDDLLFELQASLLRNFRG